MGKRREAVPPRQSTVTRRLWRTTTTHAVEQRAYGARWHHHGGTGSSLSLADCSCSCSEVDGIRPPALAQARGYRTVMDMPASVAEHVLRELPRLAKAVKTATRADGVRPAPGPRLATWQ